MSTGPSSKRKDSPSYPSVNELGLPLDTDVVTPVASSAHNSLGESSNNRSMGGMSFLAPPPLMSRSRVDTTFKTSSQNGKFNIMPPKLTKSSIMPPKLSKSTNEQKPSRGFTSARPLTWKIPDGSVKPKPPLWPLDPMSKMVMNSNPQSIAHRISDCLKRRHISAFFGDVKAKAKCVSQDRVEFRIRLYAGVGRFADGVIVEVQRRSGWSTSYSQDCHAILESSECDSVGVSDIGHLNDVNTYCTFDHVQKKCKKSTLLLSKHLLFSSRKESLLLGLQNIHSLTDPRKYGPEMVANTAQSLFLDNENEAVKAVLREIFIEKHWNGKSLCNHSKNVAQNINELVVGTLTNCFSALSKKSMLVEVLNANKWIEDEFVCVIMNIIDTSDSPYESALASRCIRDVTGASSGATNKAIELGILSNLERN